VVFVAWRYGLGSVCTTLHELSPELSLGSGVEHTTPIAEERRSGGVRLLHRLSAGQYHALESEVDWKVQRFGSLNKAGAVVHAASAGRQ
jgi:hypothetical protein